jgi:hypothetical protein
VDIDLTLYEARVIACLMEKEITSPDQYPLSLVALTNACNQKSNRDPVLELDEVCVQETVDELIKKYLVMEKTGFGSRVTKYKHLFCNTEFGTLKFSGQALGIICELLLRGPQTPGELRTHTNRLCRFGDVQEVEVTLNRLMEREDGPFVARLPREPGRRESRYGHLFSGLVPTPAGAETNPPAPVAPGPSRDRIDRLEALVNQLREDLDALNRKVETLTTPGVSEDPEP